MILALRLLLLAFIMAGAGEGARAQSSPALHQISVIQVAAATMSEADQDRLDAINRKHREDAERKTTRFKWMFGIIAFAGLLLWGFWPRREKEVQSPPARDNFGTARYAAPQTDMPEASRALRGVFLGRSTLPGLPTVLPAAPVYTAPQSHTLIMARTRTGKGTRIIIPTLLRYQDSMVIIDPKGENAAVTARPRRDQLGQTVHIVNPWGELATEFTGRGFQAATFNPLDVLDRNDANVVAIAQALAATVCTSTNEKDSYWTGSAAAVLAAVFLWITDEPGEEKTLARARAIISLSRKDFREKYLLRMAASSAFHGAISEMASPFIDLADETYSGIMSNLAEATRFISDPQLKAATASSSFRMTDLITARTTIYLVIPPDRMALQGTWLRLILAAAMHTFKRTERGEGAPRCMFLIDEFPALGRLDDIPRDIAVMSGHGLDFTLIVQGLDQLKHHYGPAHQTILNNCAYKWFCNVSDLDTARYLSDSLGKKTIRTTTEGETYGPGGAGGSVSHGETGRDLLSPDEVLNLGRNVAIALNPDDYPHYLQPIDYWNFTGVFRHLRNGSLASFFDPPLAYDDNPYVKAKSSPPPAHNGMSRAEALAVMGLGDGAGAQEIRSTYLRLMAKIHPDAGGTTYFAQKLNEAREVLLDR